MKQLPGLAVFLFHLIDITSIYLLFNCYKNFLKIREGSIPSSGKEKAVDADKEFYLSLSGPGVHLLTFKSFFCTV